jgi:nitrous oxidase accessory protein NosD
VRRVYLFILILAFSLLLTYCGESTPSSPTTTTSTTTTTVITYPVVIRETGERFETIQEAIDAASPGQHIDVSPGVYSESLSVFKQLYLIGENESDTVIEGGSAFAVVDFKPDADGSEIRGFTIKDCFNHGIYCERIRLVVENCILRGNNYGIYLYGTAGEVSRVTVKNNKATGIAAGSSSNLTISESVIEENDIGIACGSPIISYCTIKNNRIHGVTCTMYTSIDLGGGYKGNPGHNVIRENGSWDLYSDCVNVFEAKAEYNYWDHNTAAEIDALDIFDDDNAAVIYRYTRAAVDFEPFLTGEPSASLRMKPRLLTASSLFRDFLRSLFRADLPASAVYISPSLEMKIHFVRYELLEARFHSLANERYYPPLKAKVR